MIAPDKPFFMYFCPGATHAPHHAPKEWIEKYKGKFDMGYEALPRARVRAPEAARDLPRGRRADAAQPVRRRRRAPTASRGTPLDVVRPWDSLSDDEKRLFCRMAEVYAGFLSHTDHEIGRLLDFLEESGRAREHDRRLRLRQRRERRGRPERLGQREQVLQRHPRHDRGEPASTSTSSARRRPTTTTRSAGRGRSTRRSRCGSATTSRAASPIR